eukprot:7192400-Pyramimonas_sp.AAC.1
MEDVSGTRGPIVPRPGPRPKKALPPPLPRNSDIHSSDGTSPSQLPRARPASRRRRKRTRRGGR